VTRRKYPLPSKVRLEPRTRAEIAEEIDHLQSHRAGSTAKIQGWIDTRIAELKERLGKL